MAGLPVHPRACSNSCPSTQLCHPTISSSVVPFSSCLQSFPTSGSFLMSQVFSSGSQSIGASASVLPMNIQYWFPLGWTGWISLPSKGLSRVFSNTNSKVSILQGSASFMDHLSRLYTTAGRTMTVTARTFISRVVSSLFNMLSRFVQRRQWHPTPVLLPGKSHGRRSLEGCSPWGRWGSDTTEPLHFHFSLSCIGEGNGNPLQCSCLEDPRDRGARWAAVYGVAQSWTQLKWLSISSIPIQGFPGDLEAKESACSVGDLCLLPGSGRSPGEETGYPLQCSCLESSMEREVWQATVHGVAKSQMWLTD